MLGRMMSCPATVRRRPDQPGDRALLTTAQARRVTPISSHLLFFSLELNRLDKTVAGRAISEAFGANVRLFSL